MTTKFLGPKCPGLPTEHQNLGDAVEGNVNRKYIVYYCSRVWVRLTITYFQNSKPKILTFCCKVILFCWVVRTLQQCNRLLDCTAGVAASPEASSRLLMLRSFRLNWAAFLPLLSVIPTPIGLYRHQYYQTLTYMVWK